MVHFSQISGLDAEGNLKGARFFSYGLSELFMTCGHLQHTPGYAVSHHHPSKHRISLLLPSYNLGQQSLKKEFVFPQSDLNNNDRITIIAYIVLSKR